MHIAQRFNGGRGDVVYGRFMIVPHWVTPPCDNMPPDKSPGYWRMSLWDKENPGGIARKHDMFG